jgi:hypothetical protein
MSNSCRISLVPFEPSAAEKFSCSVSFKIENGLLLLEYGIFGPLPELSIPEETLFGRFMPGLWRRTCFECFLRQENEAGYTEWNFSLDCNWWSCRFDAYRKPAQEQPADVQPKDFQILFRENMVSLAAAIACPASRGLRIGPALILEHTDGRRSHWAIEHPGGAPDFHHAGTCAFAP